MQIIPIHNKTSKPVLKYSQISKDAAEMVDLVNRKDHPGKWKEALAISHCQVSDEPMSFFVVNDQLKDVFGSSIIINARILEKENVAPFKEACMSFGFRDVIKTKRFWYVKVEYYVPFMGFFLKRQEKEFTGLCSFIMQHETDHAKGKNIYDK